MTKTLTARGPEDLLAAVPFVLGFVPTDSVVMLTFGAERTFHARVDLPDVADHVPEMVAALLEPAQLHDVQRVAFVIYSGQPLPAERVSRRLVRRFREAGIEVVDVMRADGTRWFPMLRSRRRAAGGVPYDVATHPFAVEAVLDGRVTHASRTALAETLRADPEGVRAVAAAVADVDQAPPAWVRDVVDQHVATGSEPDAAVAARLLVSLAEPNARDAAWGNLARENARAAVAFWSGLVCRAPDDLVAHAAAVLGFCAWLAGEGALAWCAVDRARSAAPDHSLARLVADMLVAAVPPSEWSSESPSESQGVVGMQDPA